MNLPKRNIRHSYDFKLSNGKTIQYLPWLVKDEQEFLYATEGNDDKEYLTSHIEKLLQKCVDVDFSEITETDFYRLAIEIRKVSKGSDHEIIFTCPYCGNINEDMYLNLDEDVIYNEFDSTPLTINDIVITFKEITRGDLESLNKYESKNEGRFMYIIHSVESITVKDKVYSNLSSDDIKEFFEKELTPQEFKDLSNKFVKKVSDIGISKVMECLKCKKETKVYVDNIIDFFV